MATRVTKTSGMTISHSLVDRERTRVKNEAGDCTGLRERWFVLALKMEGAATSRGPVSGEERETPTSKTPEELGHGDTHL